MKEFLEQLEWVAWMDSRQQSKIPHALKDIVVMVVFATFAEADDWEEIAMFAKIYETYLRKYLRLENGVPSHDTIQRAMAMLSPEVFQRIQADFREVMNGKEGEKLKKIIAIDGKTMRGNQQRGESRPVSCRHGAMRPDSVLDRRRLMRKATKSRRFRNF